MKDDNVQSSGQIEREIPPEIESQCINVPLSDADQAGDGEQVSASHSNEDAFGGDIIEYTHHVHEYIREYISVADRKASFVFTLGAALLVYLHHQGITTSWIVPLGLWSVPEVLAFLASVILFIALVIAVAVIYPRTAGSKRGLVFWESIAEFQSPAEFADEAIKRNRASLTYEMLRHSHELSTVCRSKYATLSWSLKLGAAGAMLAILRLFF